MELATTTRHRAVSDLNDRYPHDDADVIEIKQAIALAPIDLTRAAAHIMRDGDDDADRGDAANAAPRPSSASRDLAAMVMFDLVGAVTIDERCALQDGDLRADAAALGPQTSSSGSLLEGAG
jgi:hypothetical protein